MMLSEFVEDLQLMLDTMGDMPVGILRNGKYYRVDMAAPRSRPRPDDHPTDYFISLPFVEIL